MFTFPIGFFNPVSSSGGTDLFAANVVLYLKGNGTNGSTSIVDSSPTPKTITSTAVNSTAVVKEGAGSIFFSGTTNLFTQTSSDLTLGTGDFTIEAWIYRTSGTSYQAICIVGNSTDTGCYLLGNSLTFYDGGNLALGGSITNNVWHHIAITKQGTTLRSFLNGTLLVTSTKAGINYTANTYYIGSNRSGSERFSGYMDLVRVTKGVARYTANFNTTTDTYLI